MHFLSRRLILGPEMGLETMAAVMHAIRGWGNQ
jgi:hypothetical protein